MSLFSFLRKNKQEAPSDSNAFQSRAEGESKPARRRKRSGPGEEPMDPMLPEKKRARRRLIGAIALVLAAIIGLPMVFDSEPKPLADDIAIQIPSKDKTPPPAERPAAPKIAAAEALDPKEEVIDPPSAPTVSEKAPPAEAAPTPKTPDQTAKAGVAEKPAAPPAKPADKPQAAKPDDAARAKALLEGKSDPKTETDKKPTKFVIQVAALATKEKVAELQNRLQDAGIKSYTQKIATASGDRIRIRVGPFASREEADKMRAKIVKLGLNGTIVPT